MTHARSGDQEGDESSALQAKEKKKKDRILFFFLSFLLSAMDESRPLGTVYITPHKYISATVSFK